MIDENGIEWEKLVERRESCLFVSFVDLGIKEPYWKRSHGWPVMFNSRRNLDHTIYYDKKEFENFDIFVKENFEKNNSFFREFVERGYKTCENLNSCAERIRKLGNLEQKSRKDLLTLFLEYRDTIAIATNFLMPIVRAGRILEEIVKKKLREQIKNEKAEEYYRALTNPKEETNDAIELIEFLSIVSEIRKDKELMQLFEKENSIILQGLEKHSILEDFNDYYEKHKWLGFRSYVGEPWSKEFIIERIKNMLKEDCDERLRHIKNFHNDNEKNLETLKGQLKIDKELWELIDDLRIYMHFRTHRTDVIYKSGFLICNLYKEIGRRMNISLQEVLGLTHDEITAFLEKMPSIQDIRDRVKEYGSISTKEKRIVLQGKELEDYKKMQKEEQYNADETKGSCAFAGKIQGTARIVRNKTMLDKIQPGDILIAPMTFPDFIPAMEKAAAFVTDEGGILCHAAIVSRELKKPCIIGTKTATKVFKDGDLVEVDAENGIVRKIK